MMKRFLMILVFGLLLSGNAFAKEIKVYHKDENSISISRSSWTEAKMFVVAAKHCAQYKKFGFTFGTFNKQGVPDEKGKPTRLYHCSKTNLTNDPLTGKSNIHWTNYNENHEFAQKQKELSKKVAELLMIEEYKKTCSTLGFKLDTDKFADCTLKLYVADNKETTQIVQSSSGVQEMIIYDPDRERRIRQKSWNDFLHGRCSLNALSKNPC